MLFKGPRIHVASVNNRALSDRHHDVGDDLDICLCIMLFGVVFISGWLIYYH